MHPLWHLAKPLTTAFDSRRGAAAAIHDFRLYPHNGVPNHNDWDTFLFPDNGAWRMAATPLGRHFPIPELSPRGHEIPRLGTSYPAADDHAGACWAASQQLGRPENHKAGKGP